jgi:hypothetical protein
VADEIGWELVERELMRMKGGARRLRKSIQDDLAEIRSGAIKPEGSKPGDNKPDPDQKNHAGNEVDAGLLGLVGSSQGLGNIPIGGQPILDFCENQNNANCQFPPANFPGCLSGAFFVLRHIAF